MTVAIKKGFRGLGLLVQLNVDRIVAGLVLVVALFLGAYIATL